MRSEFKNPLSSEIATSPLTTTNKPENFISSLISTFYLLNWITFLAKAKPFPDLFVWWYMYEKSSKITVPFSYFYKLINSHNLNKVASHKLKNIGTFLRKLYLKSSSKVICPFQND